jgi:arylsulfate sulfotransferase
MLVSTPTITLNPSGNAPLAALVQFETTEPTTVWLTITDGLETREIGFKNFTTDHELPVLGLKADTTYTIDVGYATESGGYTVAATGLDVTTDPLPDDFPTITALVSNPEMMEPGYTVATPSLPAGPTGSSTVIVDNEGEVVWYTPISWGNFVQLTEEDFGGAYDGQFISRVPNGSFNIQDLLYAESKNIPIQNIGDLAPIHHELFITEDDTLLTFGRIEIEVDGYPTSATDPSPRTDPTIIDDEPLIEFDLDGNILNVWNFSDIIDPTRVGYGSHTFFQGSGGLDWIHTNAAITDPRDNTIIVSSRHQDAVFKFDRDTGELVWILGNHENWTQEFQPYLLDPVGDDFEWQYHQHAMEITEDGNLLLFDNGNRRASPYDGTAPQPPEESYSRVVKYAIDEDAMEVSQVWEYVPDPAVYAIAVGDADEQPTNQNVLGNYGFVQYVDGVPGADLGKRLVAHPDHRSHPGRIAGGRFRS